MPTDDTVKISLAEYAALRGEMLGRLQAQSQTFAHVLAVGALAAGLAGAALKTNGSWFSPQDKVMLALLVPLAVIPVSMIFFDNEVMIFTIGAYIWEHVRPRLQAAEPGSYAGDVLASIGPKTNVIHFCISIARWTAFLVPSLLAYVYAWRHLGDVAAAWRTYALTLQALNSALLLILIAAIGNVTYLQCRWRWS
jgi:hypothetical protein